MTGLQSFSFDTTVGTSWRDWRYLSLVSDQGADMVSSLHSLEYCKGVQCVVTTYYDIEHGANRNMWGAIESSGLKPLMMLIMLIINLLSMPDDSDLRLRQLRDLMQEHFKVATPQSSPLFQYLSAAIHKERSLEVEREEHETKDDALWRLLQVDSYYKKKQGRCCIARFNAIVGLSRKVLSCWHSLTFELAVSAIEGGMLEKRMVSQIALKTTGGDEASVGEAGATSRKVVSTVDRTLRSCGANGVVVALATISEEVNKRHLAAIVYAGVKPMHWAGEAARRMKSVAENREWLAEQIKGGVCDCVKGVLSVLHDREYLVAADFLPPVRLCDNDAAEEIAYEDEVATVAARVVLPLAQQHLRRFLWMFGWPRCLVLALGSEAECTEVLSSFRDHLRLFRQLEQQGAQASAVAKKLLGRSHFQKLSVQQVVCACEELGFQGSEPLLSLLRERFSTIMSSAVVEHLNNWQTNSRVGTGWGGRYRRPQTCLATTIKGEVVSSLHRYTPVPRELPSFVVPRRIEKEDIAPLGPGSMDFSVVKGSGAKAPYHSPTPRNVAALVADMAVLAHIQSNFAKLENTWMGFFADASHFMCFKRVEGGDRWWLALDHFDQSAVLALPVEIQKVKSVAGPELDMIDIGTGTAPGLIPVLDLQNVQSLCFRIRSWSWQLAHLADCDGAFPPGLRFLRCTPIGTVLETCARHAALGVGRGR